MNFSRSKNLYKIALQQQPCTLFWCLNCVDSGHSLLVHSSTNATLNNIMPRVYRKYILKYMCYVLRMSQRFVYFCVIVSTARILFVSRVGHFFHFSLQFVTLSKLSMFLNCRISVGINLKRATIYIAQFLWCSIFNFFSCSYQMSNILEFFVGDNRHYKKNLI